MVVPCDTSQIKQRLGRPTHRESLPHHAEDMQPGRTGFLYTNKIRAVRELRRILIPASELERVLSLAEPYNPTPKSKSQNEEGGERA